MIGGQVERQSSSYRQGLVLGLTMAEIMLLLVFCLLLASSVALLYERQQRIAAETRLLQLGDTESRRGELSEAQRVMRDAQSYRALVEQLKQHPSISKLIDENPSAARRAEIDEAWRHLVEGAEAARELARVGIEPATAKRDAALFAEAERIKPFESGSCSSVRSGWEPSARPAWAELCDSCRVAARVDRCM